MKCPACLNALTEMQVGAVIVDICHGGCGGIWFDTFELQRVDEKQEVAGERITNIQRDPRLHVDQNRKRDCPRCGAIKLMRRLFNPKNRVEVDHCPNCGGYWLDGGELEKIRQDTERADGSSPQQGYVTTDVIRYLYRMQTEGRA